MKVNIKNKRAKFDYELLDNYIAGIKLLGSEIKSIRAGKASFTDAYCYVDGNKVMLKNLHISEFKEASYNNHEPLRDRILLLTKKEVRKIESKINEKGLTLVPVKLFINERGLAKVEIALAKGKKQYDKRESIKERDNKRSLDRVLKSY